MMFDNRAHTKNEDEHLIVHTFLLPEFEFKMSKNKMM